MDCCKHRDTLMDGSLSFSKDGDTQNKYIPATHAHDGAPRKKKDTRHVVARWNGTQVLSSFEGKVCQKKKKTKEPLHVGAQIFLQKNRKPGRTKASRRLNPKLYLSTQLHVSVSSDSDPSWNRNRDPRFTHPRRRRSSLHKEPFEFDDACEDFFKRKLYIYI